MTNSNNVFNEDNSSQADPFADKLKAITNENGEPKYKTIEDALEALAHSQRFIETLKGEKKTVEEKLLEVNSELEKRASVEDVVTRLTQKKVEDGNRKADDPPASKTAVDEEAIRRMVEEAFVSKLTQQQQEANLTNVLTELQTQYGDSLSAVVSERARELGTTPKELGEIAKTNPRMALDLLGGKKTKTPEPTRPGLNPPRTPPGQPELKTEKRIMQGGVSNKELTEIWRQVRDHTHQRLQVQT